MPVVPLPQVTAPASVAAPLSQYGTADHVVAVAQGRHAVVADLVVRRWSRPGCWLLETTPLTPVVPLPQVTAPASVAAPLSQYGLRTT